MPRDRERIRRIRTERGVAVLLVAQYLEFAQQLADDYLMMAKGAVVARGDPHEIEADSLRFRPALGRGVGLSG